MLVEKKLDIEIPTIFEKSAPITGKIESIFQMVIVACLREKQLKRGANPRYEVFSKKTKVTTIAIEEVNQGLITYCEIKEVRA